VTTDVTDGFKTSMNITNADIDDLPLEDFANKDGTIQRSSSSGEKDGKPQ